MNQKTYDEIIAASNDFDPVAVREAGAKRSAPAPP